MRKNKTKKPISTSSFQLTLWDYVIIMITIANIILFFYNFKSQRKSSISSNISSVVKEALASNNTDKSISDSVNNINSVILSNSPNFQISRRSKSFDTSLVENISSLSCDNSIWCNVPMPKFSYYKFDPPNNEKKWKESQIRASIGEQVLLKRVYNVMNHPFDFLDGDRVFRKLHSLIDIFIDEKSGIDMILPNYFENNKNGRKLQDKIEAAELIIDEKSGLLKYPWELQNKRVIPLPYNYKSMNRSPIIQLGYIAFNKNLNSYFSGDFVGGAFISRNEFINQWKAKKHLLETPIIVVCSLNENWGMLSTNFPNRTAGWGNCCNKPDDRGIYDFLNHDKTLMLVINQHSNITHPKILTLPRGLPLQWEKTEMLVWDSIRYSINNVKKDKLLFASASSWGKRPQILRCVSDKVSLQDFEGHSDTPKDEMRKTKTDRKRYYSKLSTAMFGLSLPGLGYDTFRMWELLTMGSIVVIEKGVGFDRTLWRLPALLVEDFDMVNTDMLRQAYVEAIYRADDFEFERLKQSFWYNVITNVSVSMSLQPMLDKFPMEAVDTHFARPKEPFACGISNTCGPNTLRIPKKSC